MSVTLTYYGHSVIALELNGTNVLVDPFIKNNPMSSIDIDLLEVNYILVSHGHEDHMGDTIAIAQRTGATVVANFEIANWLSAQGVKNLSGLFGDMKLIGNEGVDIAVLPIGDNFTMGPQDALLAIQMIKPSVAVPVHYNTWPLIEQNATEWKRTVEMQTSTKVHVLQSGQSLLYHANQNQPS